MRHRTWVRGRGAPPTGGPSPRSDERLLADGGREQNEDGAAAGGDPGEETDAEEETDAGDDGESGAERSNVEVVDAGEAEPADPKWEKPDLDDIPEVEGPKTRPADWNEADVPSGGKGGATSGGQTTADADISSGQEGGGDATAGMPNTARSPGQSRIQKGGTDGYVVALELCARLPEDIRLPDEAADLVPVALEAELEQDVQQFAGEQFDNPSPHVETLEFVEADEEIWLRLRLGIPPEAFADLDPDEIRERALQKLEGMF